MISSLYHYGSVELKKSSKVELDVGGVKKMYASAETISRMRNKLS